MSFSHRRAALSAARLLVVPAALAAVAVAAAPAAAHTDLEASSPAADAALAGLPPRITLTFSDPMTQKYAKVAVTTADGKSVAEGAPEVAGKTVTLAVKDSAPGTRYTVGYRVVSADGHPVSGSYDFTVKAAASAPAPSPDAEDEPAEDAEPSPSSSPAVAGGSGPEPAGSNVPVVVGAVAAGAALLAGGVVLARRRRARHGV
ncbi:Copper resistance protein C precursor [Streptomyces sp. ADI96-02]|uniref:copper resistance CopC family protein n=1 Tax=unclassified Streptomyces TaxID=2593676 RepID=UPI000F55848A|nr:copper resistance CopC family protein [Streptomyces sp. ADI96-02]RPK69231.1 Copper resistance protein C precursor [Streptomyces sp. ADI96-02]